ncbi:helicase SRCAP, putative [Plasmodium gaboni]|uniref:Helicase SRCAP, putative n=1 Tax=Plasmodium gaboni TaxID=647221 RepID=A0ABY1UL77_9APIC|nr:helicase SRCAP, putative [Plasmodium gaboni]
MNEIKSENILQTRSFKLGIEEIQNLGSSYLIENNEKLEKYNNEISSLKKELDTLNEKMGKCTTTTKIVEPAKTPEFTFWYYELKEMKGFQDLVMYEVKKKKKHFKVLSHSCLKYLSNREKMKIKKQEEEEKRLKLYSKNISSYMDVFWKKIEKLVWEEKKRELQQTLNKKKEMRFKKFVKEAIKKIKDARHNNAHELFENKYVSMSSNNNSEIVNNNSSSIDNGDKELKEDDLTDQEEEDYLLDEQMSSTGESENKEEEINMLDDEANLPIEELLKRMYGFKNGEDYIDFIENEDDINEENVNETSHNDEKSGNNSIDENETSHNDEKSGNNSIDENENNNENKSDGNQFNHETKDELLNNSSYEHIDNKNYYDKTGEDYKSDKENYSATRFNNKLKKEKYDEYDTKMKIEKREEENKNYEKDENQSDNYDNEKINKKNELILLKNEIQNDSDDASEHIKRDSVSSCQKISEKKRRIIKDEYNLRRTKIAKSKLSSNNSNSYNNSYNNSDDNNNNNNSDDNNNNNSDDSDDMLTCNMDEKHLTKIPPIIKATLRDYQHAGLHWLLYLYKNNINGILADEMGLGKTLQCISLLSYLAYYLNIWGPHLVIVPTSILINWEIELKRFCPCFKILSYYGNQNERYKKRVGWFNKDSFHICISSYSTVVKDHLVFKRKRWKYIILDEAHNIKNFNTKRWNIILSLKRDNCLLITGTPLQNSLEELWSLLHFLMPNIFTSHLDFKEWFSDPLNLAIEKSKIHHSKELINRLHTVIRPYILRRLKKNVEKEMPNKYEHIIKCKLTRRQQILYDEFINNKNVQNTLNTGNYIGLMNILIQLRKVCNHCDLFTNKYIQTPYFYMLSIRYFIPRFFILFEKNYYADFYLILFLHNEFTSLGGQTVNKQSNTSSTSFDLSHILTKNNTNDMYHHNHISQLYDNNKNYNYHPNDHINNMNNNPSGFTRNSEQFCENISHERHNSYQMMDHQNMNNIFSKEFINSFTNHDNSNNNFYKFSHTANNNETQMGICDNKQCDQNRFGVDTLSNMNRSENEENKSLNDLKEYNNNNNINSNICTGDYPSDIINHRNAFLSILKQMNPNNPLNSDNNNNNNNNNMYHLNRCNSRNSRNSGNSRYSRNSSLSNIFSSNASRMNSFPLDVLYTKSFMNQNDLDNNPSSVNIIIEDVHSYLYNNIYKEYIPKNILSFSDEFLTELNNNYDILSLYIDPYNRYKSYNEYLYKMKEEGGTLSSNQQSLSDIGNKHMYHKNISNENTHFKNRKKFIYRYNNMFKVINNDTQYQNIFTDETNNNSYYNSLEHNLWIKRNQIDEKKKEQEDEKNKYYNVCMNNLYILKNERIPIFGKNFLDLIKKEFTKDKNIVYNYMNNIPIDYYSSMREVSVEDIYEKDNKKRKYIREKRSNKRIKKKKNSQQVDSDIDNKNSIDMEIQINDDEQKNNIDQEQYYYDDEQKNNIDEEQYYNDDEDMNSNLSSNVYTNVDMSLQNFIHSKYHNPMMNLSYVLESLFPNMEQFLKKNEKMIHNFTLINNPSVICKSHDIRINNNLINYSNDKMNPIIIQIKNATRVYHDAFLKQSIIFPLNKDISLGSGKLCALEKLLSKCKREGNKCLLFTQFIKMLDILEIFLNHLNYSFIRLDGSTKVEQRQKIVTKFNNDKSIFIFISSTRSGSIGINLTAANVVIFYDTDWNPSIDKQAMDRCHRIGQTKDVHVFRFVCEYTVEENIWKKQLQKRKLDNICINMGNFNNSNTHSKITDTDPTNNKDWFTNVDTIKEVFINKKNNDDDDDMYKDRLLHEQVENKDKMNVRFEKTLEHVEDKDDIRALNETKKETQNEISQNMQDFTTRNDFQDSYNLTSYCFNFLNDNLTDSLKQQIDEMRMKIEIEMMNTGDENMSLNDSSN